MDATTVDEVLDFAIEREAQAVIFYEELAAKADRSWVKKQFEGFANEERGHKSKLEAIKKRGVMTPSAGAVADLQIGDYLIEAEPDTADLSYQDALILAMKREKAAFRLYSELAARAETDEMRDTFLALAEEEAKHKLRFEVEYDEEILQEN